MEREQRWQLNEQVRNFISEERAKVPTVQDGKWSLLAVMS